MSPPSVGAELQKYSALAWAIVVTLVVSVALFIHFLKTDHARAVDSFSINARHAISISGMRMTQLIDHVETIAHDYLSMGASNAQLSGLMHSLDVNTKLVSLCARDGDLINVLYTASGSVMTSSTSCAADYPIEARQSLPSDQHKLITDFDIVTSQTGDAQYLEIRIDDGEQHGLRAVLSSTALLDSIVLDDSELMAESESMCLFVTIDGTDAELACRVGENAGMTHASAMPAQQNLATISQNLNTSGLHWRLEVTPRLASLAGKITLLPFFMFGVALAIGVVVCIFAYQTADKSIQLEARANELRGQLIKLEQLEEQNSLLDQFAAMAAHDLQAPLRFIVSNAHLMLFELEELEHPELSDMATTQIEQGERMRSLVVDLLEFCRAGQSTLTIAPVNTRKLVDAEVKLLKTHEEFDNTQINVGALPKALHCDEDKLQHIVRNLLGNAVKFSQVNARPKVSISASRDTFHAPWTFRIRDNGPGVAAEHHLRIFRPFSRLDTSTKGTGMGLAIVRIMVDRHGGTIWIESDGTRGSTFCFTMPGAMPEGLS